MSHAALLRTCQMPWRLGLPSGVRDGADTCATAGVAAITRSAAIVARANRRCIGSLLVERGRIVAPRVCLHCTLRNPYDSGQSRDASMRADLIGLVVSVAAIAGVGETRHIRGTAGLVYDSGGLL